MGEACDKFWEVGWSRFPRWFKENWGEWEITRDMHWRDEWTHGVMEPFIVTGLAPALGCRVRLETRGAEGETRADYILLKDEQKFAYIEHENYSKKFLENNEKELDKLESSEATLKVAVAYKQQNKWGKDIVPIVKSISERSNRNREAEWMLIVGVRLDDEIQKKMGIQPFCAWPKTPESWLARVWDKHGGPQELAPF